jgi:hypothetical protein
MTGDNPPIDFRMRFLSIEKLDIKKIDAPGEIEKIYDMNQGDFLILRFELISLYKEVIDSRRIHDDMRIVDQDGFNYKKSLDYHLTNGSRLAQKYEFYPFISAELVPKIKYKGAIPFYVPKEEHAEYGFAVYKGSVHEI